MTPEAVSNLLETSGPAVRRILASYGIERVDDAMQDVLVKLLRSKTANALTTNALTILVRRELISMYRRDRRLTQLEPEALVESDIELRAINRVYLEGAVDLCPDLVATMFGPTLPVESSKHCPLHQARNGRKLRIRKKLRAKLDAHINAKYFGVAA